jgi:hypothetical protein
MKKLSGRKILGVFIFCFVSIVVCGNLPATKRNDLALRLSQLHDNSALSIFTISSENLSFQATSNAVIQQHCVVNKHYNNKTSAFVALVPTFLKSKFKYNRVTPVPQAQAVTSPLLSLFTKTFHFKWLASGLYHRLQFNSITLSL